MTPDDLLARLEASADPEKAARMAAYHKAPRRYLGVGNPVLDALARDLRPATDAATRVALAAGLWEMDIHETRILAAKLLTQSRIRPDDTPAWELIRSWVPGFDGWAVADHAAMAGGRRLVARPERLDEIEPWVVSDHLWTARAALTFTLPWTKQRHPKPEELEARERILGWAARIAERRDWFLQKAVAWWLRDLSRRDPDRTRAWLETHGDRLKPFARKEAARHLP